MWLTCARYSDQAVGQLPSRKSSQIWKNWRPDTFTSGIFRVSREAQFTAHFFKRERSAQSLVLSYETLCKKTWNGDLGDNQRASFLTCYKNGWAIGTRKRGNTLSLVVGSQLWWSVEFGVRRRFYLRAIDIQPELSVGPNYPSVNGRIIHDANVSCCRSCAYLKKGRKTTTAIPTELLGKSVDFNYRH